MRWVVLVLAACGQPPVRPVTAPRPVGPVTPARIELQSSAGFDRGLDVAFDNAPPSFAYVRGDEVMAFDYDRSAIDGPRRSSYVRYQLGHTKAIERLPIIDDDLWRNKWAEPPPAAMVDKLHLRATAVRARIHGMEPLTRITDWTKLPAKVSIGRVIVTAVRKHAGFDVELDLARDGRRLAHAEVRQFDTTQTHQEDEASLPCTYNPDEVAVYSDGDRVLVIERYSYSIDCDDRDHAIRMWSLRSFN